MHWWFERHTTDTCRMVSRLTSFLLVLSVMLLPSVASVNVTATTYEGIYGSVTIGQEPRGRGTFGIALSCTVTFFFCVWTAVHPNIVADASAWGRIWYKLIWMILSVLVPEGITVCAYTQWRDARVIRAAWREKMGVPRRKWVETLDPRNTAPDDGLGLDGAFFVVMGGFVVDLQPTDSASTTTTAPDDNLGRRITTLSPAGFIKYMKEGYIHSDTFHRASITDKGKTSSIAKSLAGIQALWFLVQCASRWTVGLPVTLLEIHVAIQVLFTAILFMFWWSKPLDVNVPIKIILRQQNKPEEKTTSPLPMTPIFSESDLEWEEAKLLDSTKSQVRATQNFHTRPTPPGLIGILAKASHDLLICLSEGQIGAGKFGSKQAMAFEGVMTFIGGSLHAVAWNSSFPTTLECWLWRSCSIGICILPVIITFLTFLSGYEVDLAHGLWVYQMKRSNIFTLIVGIYGRGKVAISSRVPENPTIIDWILRCIQMFASCFTISLYFFAIWFITVESYIALRSPPDGTFMTPQWVNYWPHI